MKLYIWRNIGQSDITTGSIAFAFANDLTSAKKLIVEDLDLIGREFHLDEILNTDPIVFINPIAFFFEEGDQRYETYKKVL
jgi:hypothetical protein